MRYKKIQVFKESLNITSIYDKAFNNSKLCTNVLVVRYYIKQQKRLPNYACSFYINHHRSYEIHISLAVCTDNMTDKHIMHTGATQWLLLSMDKLFGLVCVSVTQQCIFSSRNCKRRQYNITLCKCHRYRSCTNTSLNHESMRPCHVLFSWFSMCVSFYYRDWKRYFVLVNLFWF